VQTSYDKPSTWAARALTGGHPQDRLAGTCASAAVLDRPFDGQQNSREPTEVEIPPGTKDHSGSTPALQSAQWPIVSRSTLLSRRPPYLNLPALYIRRLLFLSSRLSSSSNFQDQASLQLTSVVHSLSHSLSNYYIL
jgi:hypothetical protein